jgi:DNA-directed RNA polymerase specialized sigma24 family protein
MTSPKGSISEDRSARMKAVYALTPRQRRYWFAKLLEAQEAVEKAEDDLTKLMGQAYQRGVSYDGIAGATGTHASTVRTRIMSWVEQGNEIPAGE